MNIIYTSSGCGCMFPHVVTFVMNRDPRGNNSCICVVMLCFGCGCDISNRPTDRRRLDGPSSSKVITLWKALVLQYEHPILNNVTVLDNLLSGNGDPSQSGKMCRKCFASYERLVDLTESLRCNLSKFLNAEREEDGPTPAKRPHYSTTRFPNFHLPNTSTTPSPPVAVSFSKNLDTMSIMFK